MTIYCCGCQSDVEARLTNGREIYPQRRDLSALPFWICDTCHNYVGCHHKTSTPTKPMGCLPTPEIREARKRLHAVIDPLWQSWRMSRLDVYAAMSRKIGRPFHTAETRSLAEIEQAAKCWAEIIMSSHGQ